MNRRRWEVQRGCLGSASDYSNHDLYNFRKLYRPYKASNPFFLRLLKQFAVYFDGKNTQQITSRT